jgi:hypothetical protein
MKAFVMAAGALLIGTSAYAYDAGKSFDSKLLAKPDKIAAIDQEQQMKKAVVDVLSDAKAEAIVQPASAVTWDSDGADATWKPASAVTWDEVDKADASTKLTSDAPDQVDTSQGDRDMDLTVDPDSTAPVEAAADTASEYQGVGGPDEAVQVASAELAPRPAAGNYPPCRPGPGDDNCIQLYEPGVREQLASWNQPTGGLAGVETQTAMGGPYEPVETGAADEVMANADTDTVPQTLAYSGDGINSGPLDEEGVV